MWMRPQVLLKPPSPARSQPKSAWSSKNQGPGISVGGIQPSDAPR